MVLENKTNFHFLKYRLLSISTFSIWKLQICSFLECNFEEEKGLAHLPQLHPPCLKHVVDNNYLLKEKINIHFNWNNRERIWRTSTRGNCEREIKEQLLTEAPHRLLLKEHRKLENWNTEPASILHCQTSLQLPGQGQWADALCFLF